jgi:AhpD family alkylhydroperoxidase
MQPRIEYGNVAPGAMTAMLGLEDYVRRSGLEPSLLELVKLRASQINGCAYCADMHTKDARRQGEAEQRLYAIFAWRETPFFTDRERAALAWTEAVTLVNREPVSDEVYRLARQHFGEKELVDLTLAVIAINGWNRLAVGFRTIPGSYQPAALRDRADGKSAAGASEFREGSSPAAKR